MSDDGNSDKAKRGPLLVLLLLLGACDSGNDALGSSNFDVRETGMVGSGRLKSKTAIFTDRQTGCEYIATAWEEVNLTPRLAVDGRPRCPKTARGERP